MTVGANNLTLDMSTGTGIPGGGTAHCLILSGVNNLILKSPNIIGGGSASQNGLNFISSGTVTITGNVIGGTASSTFGIGANSVGTITISGNVIGASTGGGAGINLNGSNTLNITGQVSGGPTGHGVYITSASTVTIIGDVTGGTNGIISTYGVYSATTIRLSITGQVTGGTNTNTSYGVNIVASAQTTVSITGGLVASTVAPAAFISPTVSSAILIGNLICASNGFFPVYGAIKVNPVGTSQVARVIKTDGTNLNLVDPSASADLPANSDVRYGITFNFGNNTGTCYVPAAGSVAFGANVDDTTGMAILTQANVEAALAASTIISQLDKKIDDAVAINN